jgi:leucyl aminopeptidase
MTSDPAASIPLCLLYEDEVESWLEAQAAPTRRFAQEQNFKAERHRIALIPDAAGTLALALGGLGRRQGAVSLWLAAGVADRLPPRRFSLTQRFTDAEATAIALGFAYAAYRFERYKRTKPESPASLEDPPNADRDYVASAARVLREARDMINTPAGDFGPAELAAAARELGVRTGAVYAEWVGEDLLKAGFPTIHAVGRASASAPRLVELRWSPAAAGSVPKLVLIGKGVCFDTGGLDLKPGTGMALMKKDMGGAAIALALADLLICSGVRAELRVLIPAVENSVAGNAYRPGDVITTRKGLSVEVGNTDAEGRLVLCDALALADAERPDLIIDFATLTGAARIALGPDLPALFGSDEAIVAELARTAAAEHDPLWPMPLWAGYDEDLGSKIADLNNMSSTPFAGAIVGALFLKRFVTETAHWLHIDLYAWNPKDRPGRSLGGEAQALRGVHRYLVQRYGTRRAL